VITVPGCPITDHDQPGTGDHDHFGTLIMIIPESRSRSFGITDHDRLESPGYLGTAALEARRVDFNFETNTLGWKR
jgi:hypothetical protein